MFWYKLSDQEKKNLLVRTMEILSGCSSEYILKHAKFSTKNIASDENGKSIKIELVDCEAKHPYCVVICEYETFASMNYSPSNDEQIKTQINKQIEVRKMVYGYLESKFPGYAENYYKVHKKQNAIDFKEQWESAEYEDDEFKEYILDQYEEIKQNLKDKVKTYFPNKFCNCSDQPHK